MSDSEPRIKLWGSGAESGLRMATLPEETTFREKRSRRWFRLIAVLFPFVVLFALEMGLRLAGFGYPSQFFLPAKVQNRDCLIENQSFTRRFFPPSLARSPQPTVMDAQKAKDTCRIFVFGESAAMGDPEPAFGFPRILEVLLNARYPGTRFEVVNVAITAINSHVVREIAADCEKRQGDIWIIYMGNNEVVGPFGAGTVFGSQVPGLALIRASVAFKATRIGELFDEFKRRLFHSDAPSSWEGMEMFLKQQVPESDLRMAKVHRYFDLNLESILRHGEKSGAAILLSTVASNLKDCPPFASQHGPRFSEVREDWERAYQAAKSEEEAGNFPAAIVRYASTLKLDPDYAEAEFRLARCLAASDKLQNALMHYERARDLDTLRFRADSDINKIIRKAASRHASNKLKLFDAAKFFSEKAGIPGNEFFFEHVHFNFEGNYLIARAMAEQLEGIAPGAVRSKSGNRAEWLSSSDCARRLAFTPWDQFQVIDGMVKRLELPPFTQQLGSAQRLDALRARRAELQAAVRQAHEASVAQYQEALKSAPDDWVLHENFAKLLQAIGEAKAAEKEWRKTAELLPHSASVWYSLGNVLDGQGDSGEALACFHRALKLNPSAVEARNGLGLALMAMGRKSEAVDEYQHALRDRPGFSEARVNLGQSLAQQGDAQGAIAQYRTALNYNSNSVAAHINLGKLLAQSGQTNAAEQHYREAVRIKPDDPIAQFNLGNLLAGQGKSEALTHLTEAARLKPDFAEAHYNLGLELAKQNQPSEALPHLEKAAQLKPDMPDVHLNLGVAYAKQQRFADAAREFEQTLRLDPGNPLARRYLDQAKAREGK